MSSPQIHYVSRARIDDARWNATVAADASRLPYGFSWWLDIVTDGKWNALISDDYRSLLALPYATRYGLRRIVRPPFTQQCGPWGEFTPSILSRFQQALPLLNVGVDLPLREMSVPPLTSWPYQLRQRTNMTLDLSPGYEEVSRRFSQTRRNRLNKLGLGELTPIDARQGVDIYRSATEDKAKLPEQIYARLDQLAIEVERRENGGCFAVLSDEGEILAAGVFPEYKGRVINLASGSTEQGYAVNGMERLLANLMRERAAPGALFDFEGSDLPGVAAFFRKFKPQENNYYHLQRGPL